MSISSDPVRLVTEGDREGRTTMTLQVTVIMIGVKDLARSKTFYGEGLGCTIDQDYPSFVSFSLGEGSSSLALTSGKRPLRTRASPPRGPGSGVSRSTSSSVRAKRWTRSWSAPWPPVAGS